MVQGPLYYVPLCVSQEGTPCGKFKVLWLSLCFKKQIKHIPSFYKKDPGSGWWWGAELLKGSFQF